MKDFLLQMPRKTAVGFSKSKELVDFFNKMGLKNILIVVDYNLRKMGILEHIFNNLKRENISFAIFDNIKNEPTITEIDRAIRELRMKCGLRYDLK